MLLYKFLKFGSCLLLLFILSNCTTASNITKTINQHPIVHLTNSINFVHKNTNNKNIYLKVSNFTSNPDLIAEEELILHFSKNNKYQVVKTIEEADLIIDIRIMSIMPITKETLEKINKYWIYQSVTDNGIVNNISDLDNSKTSFIMEDSGILVANGQNMHTRLSPVINKNVVEKIAEPDILSGAIIGGTIAAFLSANPYLISVGFVTGAGIGGIIEDLTSIKNTISIVDIVIKEKVPIGIDNSSNIKYKNIFSLSKNIVSEIYIDKQVNKELLMEHSTRLSIISNNMKIMPNKIYKLTNNAIVKIVSEILR